jgi:hypothetical protein
VARAKDRATALPEQAAFLEACTALRRQQGEEVALSQQLQGQRGQLEKAEGAYQKAVGRLRELQSSASDGSASRMLEGLQEEVAGLRFQVRRAGFAATQQQRLHAAVHCVFPVRRFQQGAQRLGGELYAAMAAVGA